MENNQQPTQPVATPAAEAPSAPAAAVAPQMQPQATTPPPPMTSPVQHKSKFGMLFIALFLLGILFLGGTYLFVMSQKKTSSPMPIVNQNTQTQKNIHSLQQDLPKEETTTDTDTDFTQVDAEMKNL